MKRASVIFTAALCVLHVCCSGLWARPTSDYEAGMVVAGWLKADPQPLDTVLGQQVMNVQTFMDDEGEPVYYIVRLQPSGFVIVSADDLVEPIIGFAADGVYDPSPDDPLGALVTNDLNGRVAWARGTGGLHAMAEAEDEEITPTDTQAKWNRLIRLGEPSGDSIRATGVASVSDVRVGPLITTKWDQLDDLCGRTCYNYYTPNNYKCGCCATALAQVMRYHQHPATGIGVHEFNVFVDHVQRTASTRGGDGVGGPYRWAMMVDTPDCTTTLEQRQAIGALCYDASVAIRTHYTESSSTSTGTLVRDALLSTFNYTSAVYGANNRSNLKAIIEGMISTNLDANHPVMLGVTRETGIGHFLVCDGYGYEASAMYHHFNMGHEGRNDAWYNLPTIDTPTPWDMLSSCVYNIFISGSGEIVSGRVTDSFGNPISNANVTATQTDGNDVAVVKTNARGIYALVGLRSDSPYTVNVDKQGFLFEPNEVQTGHSTQEVGMIPGKLGPNYDPGNRWGINFVGVCDCNRGVTGTGTRADPYLISTAEQLNTLFMQPCCWDKCFRLTADIDLSGFSYIQAPLAPDTVPDDGDSTFQGVSFGGVFDGDGHTISHLTIKGTAYLGLFGYLASGAEVRNLAVADVNITGSGHDVGGLVGCNWGTVTRCSSTAALSGDKSTGGLVGSNYGTVSQCYSAGVVTGNSQIGGLAGLNNSDAYRHYGVVTMCYSTSEVCGKEHVGGLIGHNWGGVRTSYSVGTVRGPDGYVGGLAGSNNPSRRGGGPGTFEQCFWDTQTSGQGTSKGGTGKTTDDMHKASTFLEAGWDFVAETTNGIEDVWWVDEGKDYPRLSWELLPASDVADGSGHEGDLLYRE